MGSGRRRGRLRVVGENGEPVRDPAGMADDELLDAAKVNRDALAEFYRRHGTGLFAYFQTRCLNPNDAYDLVAETFAEVIVHLDRYDPDRGAAVGWVYGIAKHKLHHLIRKRTVETRYRHLLAVPVNELSVDDLERLETEIDLRDSIADVRTAVASMSPALRQAVTLRVIDERTYPEVAATLGVSEPTARKRVQRGLAQLDIALGAPPDEEGRP